MLTLTDIDKETATLATDREALQAQLNALILDDTPAGPAAQAERGGRIIALRAAIAENRARAEDLANARRAVRAARSRVRSGEEYQRRAAVVQDVRTACETVATLAAEFCELLEAAQGRLALIRHTEQTARTAALSVSGAQPDAVQLSTGPGALLLPAEVGALLTALGADRWTPEVKAIPALVARRAARAAAVVVQHVGPTAAADGTVAA